MSEECSGNEFDGRLGLRISSIFVILVGSTLGACFPVFAANHKSFGSTSWMFFIAKYFGSGVIVATAFVSTGKKMSFAFANAQDCRFMYVQLPARHAGISTSSGRILTDTLAVTSSGARSPNE